MNAESKGGGTRKRGNFLNNLQPATGKRKTGKGRTKTYTTQSAQKQNTIFSLLLGSGRLRKEEKTIRHTKRREKHYNYKSAAGERKAKAELK